MKSSSTQRIIRVVLLIAFYSSSWMVGQLEVKHHHSSAYASSDNATHAPTAAPNNSSATLAPTTANNHTTMHAPTAASSSSNNSTNNHTTTHVPTPMPSSSSLLPHNNSSNHTAAPTQAPTTAAPIAPPVPPPVTTTALTRGPVLPPSSDDHPRKHILFLRILGKTIAWLIFILLSALAFGAIMSHRYCMIYFFLRGCWYTFLRLDCTIWLLSKLDSLSMRFSVVVAVVVVQ